MHCREPKSLRRKSWASAALVYGYTRAWRMPTVQRKEKSMATGFCPLNLMLTDRRHGCRGSEVASNLQKRRIACC